MDRQLEGTDALLRTTGDRAVRPISLLIVVNHFRYK